VGVAFQFLAEGLHLFWTSPPQKIHFPHERETMGSRRAPRKHIDSAATVAGMDVHGRSFLDSVVIRDISDRGLHVDGVRSSIKTGDIVVVRAGENKGRFQVMWVRPSIHTRYKTVGLEHLMKCTIPWDIDLPPAGPDEFQQARGAARRKHSRYSCEIPVEMRFPGTIAPQWGGTGDVSEGGCFVKTSNILPVGSPVEIALWLGELKMWAHGVVVTNLCGFGTGIKFVGMPLEGMLRLREHIATHGEEIPDRRFDMEVEIENADVEQIAIGHYIGK
jgi:PilZ domain